jgi:hypothetical protein
VGEDQREEQHRKMEITQNAMEKEYRKTVRSNQIQPGDVLEFPGLKSAPNNQSEGNFLQVKQRLSQIDPAVPQWLGLYPKQAQRRQGSDDHQYRQVAADLAAAEFILLAHPIAQQIDRCKIEELAQTQLGPVLQPSKGNRQAIPVSQASWRRPSNSSAGLSK